MTFRFNCRINSMSKFEIMKFVPDIGNYGDTVECHSIILIPDTADENFHEEYGRFSVVLVNDHSVPIGIINGCDLIQYESNCLLKFDQISNNGLIRVFPSKNMFKICMALPSLNISTTEAA